jgi:hypothetical protein
MQSRAFGSALGHEDQFPPPSLSGRCRLGEATFTGMGGKEENAPKAAVPTTRSNRWSDPKLSFVARAEIGSS